MCVWKSSLRPPFIENQPTLTSILGSLLSHHPLEHKRSVVHSLLHRAQHLVSDENDKLLEMDHVKAALRANEYKDWMLTIPNKPPRQPTASKAHTGNINKHKPVGIPYIKGLYEQLQRLFGKYNIQVYHQPWNTLCQRLVHPKDQLDMQKKCDVIYHIKCPECNQSYVGETSRSIGQRFKEHCKTTGNNF